MIFLLNVAIVGHTPTKPFCDNGPMTDQDFFVALTLWREARGEELDGIRAVRGVIMNRLADGRWPNTLAEVVLQPRQFSCFNPDDPQCSKLPMPGSPGWSAWQKCVQVASEPFDSMTDPSKGANHYHDKSIAPPYRAWLGVTARASQLEAKLTAAIGRLRFYKL